MSKEIELFYLDGSVYKINKTDNYTRFFFFVRWGYRALMHIINIEVKNIFFFSNICKHCMVKYTIYAGQSSVRGK